MKTVIAILTVLLSTGCTMTDIAAYYDSRDPCQLRNYPQAWNNRHRYIDTSVLPSYCDSGLYSRTTAIRRNATKGSVITTENRELIYID